MKTRAENEVDVNVEVRWPLGLLGQHLHSPKPRDSVGEHLPPEPVEADQVPFPSETLHEVRFNLARDRRLVPGRAIFQPEDPVDSQRLGDGFPDFRVDARGRDAGEGELLVYPRRMDRNLFRQALLNLGEDSQEPVIDRGVPVLGKRLLRDGQREEVTFADPDRREVIGLVGVVIAMLDGAYSVGAFCSYFRYSMSRWMVLGLVSHSSASVRQFG